MTLDNILVFIILAISVLLFVSDRLRVDLVALFVLVALIVTGLLTPQDAFSGFANPAVITVWAVFIISGALFHSGVADSLAQAMLRLGGQSPLRLLVVLMVTVGVMSAFMNNIGAVAILLPAVISLGRRLHIPPSKLLMPLAFAALLGGNMTLIGTPPNILASNILMEYGGIAPFRFFDFLPMGLVVLGAGIIYMVLVGRHLLPDRHGGDELVDVYPVRSYVSEFRIQATSSLVGRTVPETEFGQKYALDILRVRHDQDQKEQPDSERPLQAGDVLLFKGALSDMLRAGREQGLVLAQEWQAADWHPTATESGMELAEITVAPRTSLGGQTLREIDFRMRYGLSVLAIQHSGESLINHLGDVPIEFGDALLVQGPPQKINLLRKDRNFLILETPSLAMRRTHKAPLAVLILIAALVVVTVGWLDTSTTFLLAALLMVVAGVLKMEEAYEAIDWKAVFLIAGMLPLGIAMEETGTARLLANGLITVVGDLNPVVALAGIFVLTALLTEVISNAAATVLMVPIAIDTAVGIDVSLQPFVMATVLAASTSFLMPVGHQVNVIIYGPGGYKFTDYTRVGVGLNVLMLLLVVFVLPLIWPL